MKKSIIAGLFGTIALAGKVQKPLYHDTEPLVVDERDFPAATGFSSSSRVSVSRSTS